MMPPRSLDPRRQSHRAAFPPATAPPSPPALRLTSWPAPRQRLCTSPPRQPCASPPHRSRTPPGSCRHRTLTMPSSAPTTSATSIYPDHFSRRRPPADHLHHRPPPRPPLSPPSTPPTSVPALRPSHLCRTCPNHLLHGCPPSRPPPPPTSPVAQPSLRSIATFPLLQRGLPSTLARPPQPSFSLHCDGNTGRHSLSPPTPHHLVARDLFWLLLFCSISFGFLQDLCVGAMNFAKLVVQVMLLLEPVHHYFQNQLYSFKLQHFLQGQWRVCSAALSPPNAAPGRSTTRPRAVQRWSRRPFMNATQPWILLLTVQFNFC